MMRVAAMTLTGLLVVLAMLQALVFAALPALNHWRAEIEQALSTQLAVPITLSEVGVRLSLRGPYVEALDVVMEQPSVRIELRRLQVILDAWASLQAGAPVIAALAIDEGSAVWLGDGGQAREDPWQLAAATLGALQAASERIGAASIDDFSVIADGWTLTRLDVDLIPGQGLLARARLDTEAQSLPLRLDWRFAPSPTAPQVIHWAIDDARLPVPMGDTLDVFVGIQSTGSLVIAPNAPVTGSLSLQLRDLDDLGLTAGFTAMIQAESPARWAWMADRFDAELPGVTIKGPVHGQWVDGQWELAIDRIDLDGGATLSWMDQVLPETAVSRLVRLNQPRMTLSSVQAHWATERGLSWLAEVEAATIAAGRGIPTLGPVKGQVYAEGQSGWFDFEGADTTFALPEIFPMPWQNHRVSGRLVWARAADGLTVIGRNLRVAGQDQDVRGELLLDLPRTRQQGLQLELQADANVGAMPGLLPTDLDAPVQDFLLKSIRDAEIKAGRIHYAGPLGPTDPVNRRELVLEFPVARIDFQPLAEWPSLIGNAGLVRWANQRADIELVGPDFGALEVVKVSGRQDRENGRLIHLEGTLKGTADAVQDILQSAGVKPAALGRDVLVSGDLQGSVALQIPLGQAPQGSVRMHSQNARVAFAGWPHVLTDVTGQAEFVFSKGLVADGLQASVLGAPVEIDLSATDDQFTGRLRGALTGAQALAVAGIPIPEGSLVGSSDWRVTVASQDGALQIDATTSGQGLQSDLPMPLVKSDIDAESPIRVQLVRREGAVTVTGEVFDRVRFSSDLATDPVTVTMQASEIDLLGWAGLGGTGEATNLTIMMALDRAWLGDVPLAIDSLRFERTPRSLVVVVDGEELSGTVSRAGQDPVSLRLDRLKLPEGGAFLDPPGDDPLAEFDPGSLPPLAVAIELLERGSQRYERLYLDIRPGPARLDVNNLSFVRDGQLFTGELAWDEGDSGTRSALILRAQGAELGNFLRVSAGQALLEAKRGQLTVSVQWPGSPLAFSPLTAAGEISLSLEDGRFLELGNTAEVLRLFGILNIETLTRRLRLDFLDLVKPGVAFDVVKAQAQLGDGVLRLDPALDMQGPASSFRLTGDADLRSKTLQQRLAVDIPLTGNLPLASVLLGAPQIGGAIYFVEKAFGTKIIQVGKTEYAIEGAFSDPKISLIPPFTKPKETPNAQSNRDPQ